MYFQAHVGGGGGGGDESMNCLEMSKELCVPPCASAFPKEILEN